MTMLPLGWTETTVGQTGRWVGGGTPSRQVSKYWESGTIPWVSPKDMKSLKVNSAEDYITEDAVENSATNRIRRGSVLVVTRSGILRHTLPVAVSTAEVCINQDLKAIETHLHVDADFIAWALRRYEKDILDGCAKDGTTVQSVDTALLQAFPLPLPPLPEQRRIVEALEEQFSRLDAGVASLRRAQRNLGRLRAAILSAAVEGRLVEPEGEWAPTRIGGDAETNAEVRISIPASWHLKTLGSLCKDLRYGTSEKCSYEATGAPVLRIPNVRGRTIDNHDLKYAVNADAALDSVRVEPGDLLFVRTNGSPDLIGRVGVVPPLADGYAFASYLIRGRLGPEVISKYCAVVLDGPQYRRVLRASAATSAGQYNLSASTLSRIPIPVPPIHEQEPNRRGD